MATNTRLGRVGILGSAKGLAGTKLPQPSVRQIHQLLRNKVNQSTWSPYLVENLLDRLKTYFAGCEVTFPDELDLSGATPFQCEVWQATRLIPYGETRSYAWIAEQIGKPGAARAVGQALARNPLPVIVPCHRVVTNDGKLGGFSRGLKMKKYLLALEASAKVR